MAEPVPLIFSCDTEDYETPASDDAELLWARMFARHGVRACFCVVGEEARALRDRGRRDVLAALAQHEIASHSNCHSAHPTPAEYLEPLSFIEGAERFRDEEAIAVRDLTDLLGQQPSAWCKPGNSWGPAVPYAAAKLGMPVFCDAPFEEAPGQPLWFAGGLLLKYHTSFDRYFAVAPAERPGRMRADFEALLAARLAEAERSRTAPGTIVMYTHPCRTVTAAFPSNFTAGKNPPRAEWQPAPLRPQAEVDSLLRDFDAFLGWVAELRAQGRVVLTTYRELYARVGSNAGPAAQVVPVHPVMELARALAVDNAPLMARRVAGQWRSPADQLGLIAAALAHATTWNELPKTLTLRSLLGPLDGPGDAEVGAADRAGSGAADDAAAEPVASALPRHPISLAIVQRAAQDVDACCERDGAIPRSVDFSFGSFATARSGSWRRNADQGASERGAILGPGQALRAIARGLVVWNSGAHNATVLTLPTGGDAPAFAQRADIQALRFQNTWSIFPPDFTGRRLLAQIRLQSWTAAPARH